MDKYKSVLFKASLAIVPTIMLLCYCIIVIALFLMIILFYIFRNLDADPIREIYIDGVKRNYILHFPKNYNNTQQIPLVVGLHGGFGNARQYKVKKKFFSTFGKNDNGWDRISDENNFIVLYPYGYHSTGRLFLLAWNSGSINSESYRANVSDVSFIKQLTEKIISDYNINQTQVYCTGHSNGAMMCYRMAGEASTVFQGVAPVSGSCGGYFYEGAPKYIIPTPTVPIKLVHVHGLQDTNVKLNGGRSEGPGGIEGRIDLPINDTLKIFKTSNQCGDTITSEFSTNNLIELKRYQCANNQRNIQLYYLKNRGHMWDDMNTEVRNEKFKGTDLAEAIWNLLKIE